MPLIQVRLTEDENKILERAAKVSRRSKRDQLAFSAIEHAKSLVLTPAAPVAPAKKGGAK